jgi:hypothetical protein
MEHQLKLHSEALQQRVDDLEKEVTILQNQKKNIEQVSLFLKKLIYYRKF